MHYKLLCTRAMTRGCLCTRIRKSRVELLCEQKSKMRPVFVCVPGLSTKKSFNQKCTTSFSLYFNYAQNVCKIADTGDGTKYTSFKKDKICYWRMANKVSRPDLDIFFMSKRSTGLILDSLCLPHVFVVSWPYCTVDVLVHVVL